MNIRAFISTGFFLILFASIVNGNQANQETCIKKTSNCITFSVSEGTGCAWMCSYCATKLGTNNYYFTDDVCTYLEGAGCVGNPIAGVSYTCCSTGVQ